MAANWGSTFIQRPDGSNLLNMDNFKQQLEAYQSDGADYLYDIEPQAQNMFWAGFFRESGDRNVFHNAQYRIRKVSIPLPKMDVEIHPQLRFPIFKEATYSQDVSIDWFEDVYHSVTKYHQNWHSAWYNREYDVLRCGVDGKFRQLTVAAYHYVNSNNSTSLIETPTIQPIMAFRIGGLIPLSWGEEITWDHANDAGENFLQCRYKCGIIEWIYADGLQLWNPKDFAQPSASEGSTSDAISSEYTRLANSLITMGQSIL